MAIRGKVKKGRVVLDKPRPVSRRHGGGGPPGQEEGWAQESEARQAEIQSRDR